MPSRRRVLASLALLLFLTGCWDRREIEERANNLALGIDRCEDGAACNIIATRQIAIPGRIPMGGGAGQGSGEMETVAVTRSEGLDGPETLQKVQAELNRKISFGHTRVMVFSEEFARVGVGEYLDYVRRLPDVRRMMWVAVSEGPAEEVMRARPSLERVPALYLNDMFDDAVKTGRLPPVFIGEFLIRLSNRGEDAIAPLIRMPGPDHPALAGLAVFRGYRMVGKLSPAETATYMEVRGQRRGSERLAVPLPEGRRADLAIYGRQTHYRVWWEKGRVHAYLKMELESDLVELTHDLRGSDPQVLDVIERQAASLVKQRSAALVNRLQTEFGADILGLGERVRAFLPDVWKTIDDWPAAFAKAQFSFEVTVHVRNTGLTME